MNKIEVKRLKYTMAYSNKHNCKNQSGHQFNIIADKEKKNEIRKERPDLKAALWECIHCYKIMESM